MSDLEPITREEALLDGRDLTPITRKEMFIKRIYDNTQNIPEPITREEYFLKKAGEGGGSSVTVEALTVTENGTYSEEGKAYSPVTVNVDKGLEIVDLPSAEVVSFSDGEALPITSGKFHINAVQEGSGTPSPDNVRPITGFSSMDITRCGNNFYDYSKSADAGGGARNLTINLPPNTDFVFSLDTTVQGMYIKGSNDGFATQTNIKSAYGVSSTTFNSGNYKSYLLSLYKNGGVSQSDNIKLELGSTATTYEAYNGTSQTISFGTTNYGGYYDSVNGKLVATHGYVDMGSTTWVHNSVNSVYKTISEMKVNSDIIASELETVPQSTSSDAMPSGSIRVAVDSKNIVVKLDGITAQNAQSMLSGIQLVYELANPTESDISTTCISTLEGTNNIYHNCNGETEISVLKEA